MGSAMETIQWTHTHSRTWQVVGSSTQEAAKLAPLDPRALAISKLVLYHPLKSMMEDRPFAAPTLGWRCSYDVRGCDPVFCGQWSSASSSSFSASLSSTSRTTFVSTRGGLILEINKLEQKKQANKTNQKNTSKTKSNQESKKIIMQPKKHKQNKGQPRKQKNNKQNTK